VKLTITDANEQMRRPTSVPLPILYLSRLLLGPYLRRRARQREERRESIASSGFVLTATDVNGIGFEPFLNVTQATGDGRCHVRHPELI
jgi:hypothetical protein